MTHVVVDPVTRIEGHLRIEAEVDGGKVQDAWSSATMFRGIELILKGRDPRDAWVFTQRICGVCTTVHAIASIRAVENAIGAGPAAQRPAAAQPDHRVAVRAGPRHPLLPPARARLGGHRLRALGRPGEDLGAGRSRSPTGRSRARRTSPACRTGVKAFVERGQLGPFANAYWGHPAYKLPPEANLMAVAHYLEALEWQREVIKIHAILGGKNPHLQSFLVGGMATPVDPDQPGLAQRRHDRAAAGADRQGARLRRPASTSPTCWPSPPSTRTGRASAPASATTSSTASTPRTTAPKPPLFLPVGRHPQHATCPRSSRSTPRRSPSTSRTPGTSTPAATTRALHPFQGETKPKYTGPEAALRAARHRRQVQLAEVAALRRRADGGRPALADARGLRLRATRASRSWSALVLGKLGVGPEALFSTLGRIAARGIETLVLAEKHGRLARRSSPPTWRGATSASTTTRSGIPPRWPTRRVGRRLPRGAARRARPLGPHQGRRDRQLPVHRAEHLERRPARRGRPAGALRGGAARHAGRRPGEAARDPAHDPLLRPVPGLRRPRASTRGSSEVARVRLR